MHIPIEGCHLSGRVNWIASIIVGEVRWNVLGFVALLLQDGNEWRWLRVGGGQARCTRIGDWSRWSDIVAKPWHGNRLKRWGHRCWWWTARIHRIRHWWIIGGTQWTPVAIQTRNILKYSYNQRNTSLPICQLGSLVHHNTDHIE